MTERNFLKTLMNAHEKTVTLLRLDEKLAHALFEPALASEKLSQSDVDWMMPLCPDKAASFLRSLLPLSEFYSSRNPVLAAAIWGIWNSLSYMRRQRSLLAMLFQGQKKKAALFIHYRALVNAALIRFSDGCATTGMNTSAFDDPGNYKLQAEAAIVRLEAFARPLDNTP